MPAILVFYPAIKSNQKLSRLKQYTFIILNFWKSEAWYSSHLAKIKILAGLCSSLGMKGKIYFLAHSGVRI